MIQFTKDFIKDMELVVQSVKGELPPLAFGRFGEGEAKLMEGHTVRCRDGWFAEGACPSLAASVRECLTTDLPSWCIGISCHCCDAVGFQWFLDNSTVPTDRVTYANLFVNSNYDRFLDMYNELGRDYFHLVAHWPNHADSIIPANSITPLWDWRPLVDELRKVTKPIIMAAGPMAGSIALDYVKSDPPNPQTILDIGSTLDPVLGGRMTRRYHRVERKNRRKICTWPGVTA